MKSACLLLCALSLGAQPVDRSRPPVAPPGRPWKLAPSFETTLPNGLGVVLVQDDRLPLVTMRLTFACGNRRDPKNLPGVASMAADMLLEGTAGRTFPEIVDALDRLGASVGVSSGADQIAIAGSAIPESLPGLLDNIADIAIRATFPDLELMLLKQNRAQTLARQHAQAGYIANELFRAAIFGDHPYAHLGLSPEALEQIDQTVLLAYKNVFLAPNNAFLILVGRLPARADVLKMIGDRFGPWERKALPETADVPPPAPKRRLIIVDRPGAAQADIRLGRIAAMHRDADYFPMIVANAVVAGAPMGRMFLDIREKRGLVYDVRGEPAGFDEAGVLSFVTQVKTEATGEALQAMIDHLDRMTKEPVSAEELNDAKNAANGTMLLRLQTQAGLADDLSMIKVLRLPANFIETYTARIDAVRAADVQQAAKKYLDPGDAAIVIVGDAAKVQPQLQKIGAFEVLKAK